jgi:large subunit ribosomal protein L23
MQLNITPIVTEKSTLAAAEGKYHFNVSSNATKVQIKQTLEKMYGKKVAKVNAISVPKKTRLIGKAKPFVKRKATKKVIVTFLNKESVDINKTK